MEMLLLPSVFIVFIIGNEVTLSHADDTVNATCNFFHYASGKLIGQVNFSQEVSSNQVTLQGCVDNIPTGPHGFHVHEFGSIANNCLDAGGHFNPEGKSHGNISDSERHVGDLGNLNVTSGGTFCFQPITDHMISLLPGKHSIIGRVLALHQDVDDLGRGPYVDSKTTGHSGPRIACCVIGLTSALPSAAPIQSSLVPFVFFLSLILPNTFRVL